jgi:outer membrane protein assembly factor BamB
VYFSDYFQEFIRSWIPLSENRLFLHSHKRHISKTDSSTPNMKRKFALHFLALLLPAILSAQATAQFRGPARDGVFPATGLMIIWPDGGPALRWSNESIGNGYGPPSVTSDRVFVTGETDSTAWLYSFDHSGNLIWETAFGKEWVASYAGSRSAPTVVADRIYVSSGLGNLYCIDAGSGSILWMTDMLRGLHGRFTHFGHAESPLVEGDQVFFTPGGRDTNVVALNRFTGKINWICRGFGEIPAYNSPILIKLATGNILVTFSAYHMLGIDANNGELLWSHEQVNIPPAERQPGNGDTHSNSAYYEDGFLYYVAGDGNCGVKLKLSADGKQITQVWRNPAVDNYMGGFIKIGDRMYTGSEAKRSLLTVDALTGQVLDSLKIGNGSLALANQMLYYYTQRGEVYLLKLNNGRPEVVSRFKITAGSKEHFSHPVVSDGMLIIRRGKAMMAYDIRNK